MFPPMLGYNCFISPIEPKRKRSSKHRRTSTQSTRSHTKSSDARPHGSHRTTSTHDSPLKRHHNQASPPAVHASAPSHALPRGNPKPVPLSKPAPLSAESDNGKTSLRASMSKPPAPVEVTPCGQKSCPKRTHGKEAACKKCNSAAEDIISTSKSKSTPESKPPHRRWSIWSWWWTSAKTTEEPQDGWRCFGK
ncbi:hypothetical protein J3458_021351 [Metarhizium acridum]|uniref:uncharacterized protein n=1 Tax=Metarhizium acridum TaxID=92637 RepID=UPI001C6B0C09|nr:hypothetical protein J3458_021351 [Metarhizium acridum]